MAIMNNLFDDGSKVEPSIVEILKKSVEDFERKHHGNGLKSPFKLSQYWLDKKKWTTKEALIRSINSLNCQRVQEGRLLLYIQPNASDKPEAVLVRLTDDKTLFSKKETKKAEKLPPSKEAILEKLKKSIEEVKKASSDGKWEAEFKEFIKQFC